MISVSRWIHLREQVRVGLVGTGFAGRTLAEASHRARAGALTAIRSGAESAKLAERYGTREVPSMDALIEACDVVVVATPHSSHASLVRAALQAGRHVLCEKPLTVDADEARDLVALAAAQGVLIGVNHFQRFRAPNAAAINVIHRGELGRVIGVQMKLLESPQVKPWQRSPANRGFLLGYGIHALDLLLHMLRPADVRVLAAAADIDDDGIERSTVAQLSFDSIPVQLSSSDRFSNDDKQPGRAAFDYTVVGTSGVLVVDAYGAAELTTDSRHLLAELPKWDSLLSDTRMDAYVQSVDAFFTAVRDGSATPYVTGAEGARAVHLANQISDIAQLERLQ